MVRQNIHGCLRSHNDSINQSVNLSYHSPPPTIPSSPSLSFPFSLQRSSPSYPSPMFPSTSILPFFSPSLPLPRIQLRDLGECCKLPRWGLGWSLTAISVHFQLKILYLWVVTAPLFARHGLYYNLKIHLHCTHWNFVPLSCFHELWLCVNLYYFRICICIIRPNFGAPCRLQ